MDVEKLIAKLGPALPHQLLGLYLCGSAARGTVAVHSDIDLLAVAEYSLDDQQRKDLTAALLRLSGWAGHRQKFPEAANRRPIEFSILTPDATGSGAYPPQADYQYGEWLREESIAGAVPQPFEDPDILILQADARQNHRILSGPGLEEFLPAPAPEMLSQACRDALPALLENLQADTRNVVLTLARMVVTATTGQIVSKDEAAAQVSPTLPKPEGTLLLQAAAEYRGVTVIDWAQRWTDVHSAAELLQSMIRIGLRDKDV